MAITAFDIHDKLQEERTQLRNSVQADRFHAHPAEMQMTILRRLTHADDATEAAAAAFEAALQQLEESALWLSYPRKHEEAPPGKLAQVVQLMRLTREMAALRTQVAEVKASVQEIENVPMDVNVRLQVDVAQDKVVTGSRRDVADVEEGEIASTLDEEDVSTLEEEGDFKQTIDFGPRSVSERIGELEERLDHLSLMMYQEQDDYKDNVDAYIEDKIAASSSGAGGSGLSPPVGTKAQKLDADLAMFKEQMKKCEEAIVEAVKHHEVLDEANKSLKLENEYLRSQLQLVSARHIG